MRRAPTRKARRIRRDNAGRRQHENTHLGREGGRGGWELRPARRATGDAVRRPEERSAIRHLLDRRRDDERLLCSGVGVCTLCVCESLYRDCDASVLHWTVFVV